MLVSYLRIEERLLEHPLVEDCAVVAAALAPPASGTHVGTTAYIKVRQEALAASVASDLLSWLHDQFGETSAPTSAVILPRIPRNARDKIERKLLQHRYGALLVQADADADSALSRGEFVALVQGLVSHPSRAAAEQSALRAGALFDKHDTGGAGRLDFERCIAALQLGPWHPGDSAP